MAKGKRAVALFEVIRKDKRFDRKGEGSPVSNPVDDTRQLSQQAVELWRKKHSDPETWTQQGPTLKERLASVSSRINEFSASMKSRLAVGHDDKLQLLGMLPVSTSHKT